MGIGIAIGVCVVCCYCQKKRRGRGDETRGSQKSPGNADDEPPPSYELAPLEMENGIIGGGKMASEDRSGICGPCGSDVLSQTLEHAAVASFDDTGQNGDVKVQMTSDSEMGRQRNFGKRGVDVEYSSKSTQTEDEDMILRDVCVHIEAPTNITS